MSSYKSGPRNSGPSLPPYFIGFSSIGPPFDSATSCAEKCPKINDLGRFFMPEKVVQNVVQVSSKLGLFLLLKNPLIYHVYEHFLMFFCGRCNLNILLCSFTIFPAECHLHRRCCHAFQSSICCSISYVILFYYFCL